MRVYRGAPERHPTPIALTVGNFDGVHRGHQAMLHRLRDAARTRGLAACVMTFEPHPREFFSPSDAPPRLTCLRDKLERFRELGVDAVFVFHFNRRFASLTANQFVHDLLHRTLNTGWLLVGEDFRFGAKRQGDLAFLNQAAATLGFDVSVMESVNYCGQRVSSSAIRDALSQGDLKLAAQLLGRPFSMAGRVIHGDKLGRELGFPTANIHMKSTNAPLSGVFAVALHGLTQRAMPGVASLGVRPTVTADGNPTLEVHVFDFNRLIYGIHVRVEFLHKLRDEAKYSDMDALKQQIARDAAAARLFFEKLDTQEHVGSE